ncbi:hypothetical protein BKA83DRAFT_4209575 [Pisolithus microcarpus]|nr:hypothetical protein BKA83DRAFT_4209575 [Pisolithus microcarpus]
MKLVNTALPQTLPKECEKAARIFSSFVIPRSVLESAKGFAIFTVFKAGFLFSARAGTGIVIAKLGDGNWSAPSAIGCAGLGVGGQLGAELTDFLIVLNSTSKSFMSSGSLTLGGNMSVARFGSVNSSGKVAAMYSYSKTRGLFGGVSVEGSVIVERQDANALAYKQNVTAKMLLSGMRAPGVPGTRRWIDDRVDEPASYPFDATRLLSQSGGRRSSLFGKKKKDVEFPPQHWGSSKDSGSYFAADDLELARGFRIDPNMPDHADPFSDVPPHDQIMDYSRVGQADGPEPFIIEASSQQSKPFSPQDGVARAIALYNFHAVEAGDLTFSKGDVIVVTRKSDSTDDWWTGKVNGKEGIFPANFVELV